MALKIEQRSDFQELRPVDISAWNKDVKAFVRPLSGVEQLVFNDYFLVFVNKELAPEERFDAGFKASLMALVDENGKALLVPESRLDMWRASAMPILNIFTAVLNGAPSAEAAKKN